MQSKKVFVSGAAGVIGSQLVSMLVAQGAIVLCGDLKPKPSNFPNNVLYRQGDLNYLTQEEIDLFDPEIFIHLAATFERSTETYKHWEENFWHNIKLSNHLMTLIRNVRSIKRVVNASSYLIYDKSLYQFKTVKDKPYRLKETDPINPRNLTGLAKLAHEIELDFLSHFKSDKFTSISARIYRGYGKNSRDVISRWIRDLLQGKEIKVYNPEGCFDYMYGEDTAKGLIKLAEVNYQGIVNLGTGRSRKISDIVEILKKHFPDFKATSFELNEPIESSEADTTKLEKIINWVPEKHLEETIPAIIEFEKNKNLEKSTTLGNVLITSIASKVPLVKNVKHAIEKVSPRINLYGGDIDETCIAKYFVDYFWEMPRINELSIEQLTAYCLENSIKLIIPTRDGELLYFAKHRKALSLSGVEVMISKLKSIENCIDKLLFYNHTEVIHEIIPTTEKIEEIEAQTYVVKERFGAGSLSIGVNLSKEEALTHAKTLENPIFQPFIKGEEYSIDAYIDRKGSIKGLIVRKRVKVVNGESQITTIYSNETLERKLKHIINELKLYGHIVMQIIISDDNNMHIIECNPRFGGASSLAIYKGVDSFYWAYLEANNVDISDYSFIHNKTKVTQVKFIENKYLLEF